MARWARFTGLAQLMPYFLLVMLLCSYEKAGWLPCCVLSSSNKDHGKHASQPSHINTTTFLRGNKARTEPEQ